MGRACSTRTDQAHRRAHYAAKVPIRQAGSHNAVHSPRSAHRVGAGIRPSLRGTPRQPGTAGAADRVSTAHPRGGVRRLGSPGSQARLADHRLVLRATNPEIQRLRTIRFCLYPQVKPHSVLPRRHITDRNDRRGASAHATGAYSSAPTWSGSVSQSFTPRTLDDPTEILPRIKRVFASNAILAPSRTPRGAIAGPIPRQPPDMIKVLPERFEPHRSLLRYGDSHHTVSTTGKP